MIINFNTLKILDDCNQLVINVSIPDEEYYANRHLEHIYIDTQDTFQCNGPSQNPVYHLDLNTVIDEESEFPKEYELILTSEDLGGKDLSSNMFFIYIVTDGNFTPVNLGTTIPCGVDESTAMAVVTNMKPFYKQAMMFIKELANTCCKNKKFIDYILKLKAMEISVKTGNYLQAIVYYNSFFKNHVIIQGGGCNCGH